MDIKKLLFKYVDKAAFGLMALLFIIAATYSTMFGDALRFLRDGLEPLRGLFSSGEPPFSLAELQEKVETYQKKIEKNRQSSRPPQLEELTVVDALKSSPPMPGAIKPNLWRPPTEQVDKTTITATVPQSLPLKEPLAKDSIKVKDPSLLKVVAKGTGELELTGMREGNTEFEWRDDSGIRHIQFVEIKPFQAEATLNPPKNLRATLVGASVRLVWEAPPVDPRATPTGFNVYRRKASESEYKKIGSAAISEGGESGAEGAAAPAAPKGGGTYTDNSIEFDAEYSYVVKTVGKAKVPESGPSEPISITIPSDVEFFVKGVNPKEPYDAAIKVWKLVNKKWESKTFYGIKPGEPIGAVARVGRPPENVDFRTGAILVDTDPSAGRPKVAVMAGGQTMLMPPMYKGKIVYLDKRGELKEKWMGKEDPEELNKRFPGISAVSRAAPAETPKEGPSVAPVPEEKKKEGPIELKPQAVP